MMKRLFFVAVFGLAAMNSYAATTTNATDSAGNPVVSDGRGDPSDPHGVSGAQ